MESSESFSPEQLRFLLDGVPTAVYVYHLEDPADDHSLRLIYSNAVSAKHTGVDPSVLLGRLVDDAFPTLRMYGLPQRYAEAARTGIFERIEGLFHGDSRVVAAAYWSEVRPMGGGLVAVYFENTTREKQFELDASWAERHRQEAEERKALLEQVQAAHAAAQDALESYQLVAEAAEEALWEIRIEPGQRLNADTYCRFSSRFAELLGCDPAEIVPVAATFSRFVHQDDVVRVREAFGAMISRSCDLFREQYRVVTKPGEVRIWEGVARALFDEAGEVRRIAGTVRDITAEQRIQRALEERLAVIEQQRSLIERLSTPILRIWDGVIALPIIGAVDAERASAMMDQLLAEVSARSVQFALLDLTGVESIDTTTADQLVRIASATQLLGAQAIITGIRAPVAQAMVDLGVALEAVETRRSLREGLRDCIRRAAQARS